MRKFIGQCVEVEKLIAKTYRIFAESEHNDEELAGVWEKLAKDEEEHAMQLDFATRMPIDAAFSGVSESTPDPVEMYAIVNGILQKARNGYQDSMEMLDDALTLENGLHGIHATQALLFKDPSLLKLFQSLADSEEIHVAKLHNYLDKFTRDERISQF